MLVTDLFLWSAVRFTLTRVRTLVNLHWLLSAELTVLSVLLSATPLQEEGASSLLEVVVFTLENIYRLHRTHAQRKMLSIWLQNPPIRKETAHLCLKIDSSWCSLLCVFPYAQTCKAKNKRFFRLSIKEYI